MERVMHRILDMLEGTGHDLWSFIREKFEILFLGVLFVYVFVFWVRSEYNQNVKEVLMLVLTAFVALMRIVPRGVTNIQTDGGAIQAGSIESASTVSGDITSKTDPRSTTAGDKPAEVKLGE